MTIGIEILQNEIQKIRKKTVESPNTFLNVVSLDIKGCKSTQKAQNWNSHYQILEDDDMDVNELGEPPCHTALQVLDREPSCVSTPERQSPAVSTPERQSPAVSTPERQSPPLERDTPPSLTAVPISQGTESRGHVERKPHFIVKHSILGNRLPSHDPNVLVESTTFTSAGKIQPFLITISTNAALILDFHCHLTHSEVVGYLAGNWDVNSHNLNITHAFPCKCRLGDYESAPVVESEIRKTIAAQRLTLVGWYHSHPTAPATPSLRDIDTQLEYELRMKGNSDSSYLPCVGVICSPYNPDNPTLESTLVSYWAIPPSETRIHEYGKPMMMSYSVLQEHSISHDALLELKKCADFYKPEKDLVNMAEAVKGKVSYLEKLKFSLRSKFPRNHQDGDALWSYVVDILTPGEGKPETDILKQIIGISSTPGRTTPPAEKERFSVPCIPPPLPFKPATPPAPAKTPVARSRTSGKRSREAKNLANLSNYFVGSDLASALFGNPKYPMGLDAATKSLLNLNNLSMFLPPMSPYKSDPSLGLMKPPPPPSYFSYATPPRSSSASTSSRSRTSSANRNAPSTSRTMPPPTKVPKLDTHHMANFFMPSNLGKNCSGTNRPSTSTSTSSK